MSHPLKGAVFTRLKKDKSQQDTYWVVLNILGALCMRVAVTLKGEIIHSDTVHTTFLKDRPVIGFVRDFNDMGGAVERIKINSVPLSVSEKVILKQQQEEGYEEQEWM